jgi:hypothetical protein
MKQKNPFSVVLKGFLYEYLNGLEALSHAEEEVTFDLCILVAV